MSERKYYCMCDSNCKFETMTKEQILAAIAQAVETGNVGNCDTGFITKVKEQNAGDCVTFWVGTQAQYNAIETKAKNCMYIITDDTTTADMQATFAAIATAAQNAEKSAAASAAAAIAAASALTQEDLTDQIALSWINNGQGMNVQLRTKINSFTYIPALEVLAFNFNVYLKGTMAQGEALHFQQVGGNVRKDDGARTAVPMWHFTSSTGAIQACSCLYTLGNGQVVTAYKLLAMDAIDTKDTECGVTLSGWHFVDPTT